MGTHKKNQNICGYVTYDPIERTYELPEEDAMVLANEASLVFMASGLETVASMWLDEDLILNAFRSGIAAIAHH